MPPRQRKITIDGITTTVKGLHVRKSRGKEYFYLGRHAGSPRLIVDQGYPAFIESLKSAKEQFQNGNRKDTLEWLIIDYRCSLQFKSLAKRTQKTYSEYLSEINKKFAGLPVKALNAPKIRSVIIDWRDSMADTPRKADYIISVFSAVLSWAYDRNLVERNHLAGIKKIYHSERRNSIWTEQDIQTYLHHAQPHLQFPFLMALLTGQRQGDILAMRWDNIKTYPNGDRYIEITQSKGKKSVSIFINPELDMVLKRIPHHCDTILATSKGTSWTTDGFKTQHHKIMVKSELNKKGLHFHDLRGTFISSLNAKGLSLQQIATITGHSFEGLQVIQKYSADTKEMSKATMTIAGKNTD